MPYQKGHKKQGGRKAGSKNKVSLNIRERILSLVEPEQIYEDIERVEDFGKRAELKIKLLEYAIAKPQRITIESDRKEEQPSEVTFRFLDPIDVNDNVSTFSELPLKKQEDILKKAKIKVKPRGEGSTKEYGKPMQRTAEEKQEPIYSPPPTYHKPEPTKPEPKRQEPKREQMETVYASKFNYRDFVLK